MEVVGPLTNDPLIKDRSIRLFEYLEYQNSSIFPYRQSQVYATISDERSQMMGEGGVRVQFYVLESE